MLFMPCSCLGREPKARQSSRKLDETVSVVFQCRSRSTSTSGPVTDSAASQSPPRKTLEIFDSFKLNCAKPDDNLCSSILAQAHAGVLTAASRCSSFVGARPPESVLGAQNNGQKIDCRSPTPTVKRSKLTVKTDLEIKLPCPTPEKKPATQEEGQQRSSYCRPRTYSDDPFAPPTPGVILSFPTPSRTNSQASFSSAPNGRSDHAHSLDEGRESLETAKLPSVPQPCLPDIRRLSDLDMGEWTREIGCRSPTPTMASRCVSALSSAPSSAPSTIQRSESFHSTVTSPQLAHFGPGRVPSCYGANQIVFPQLPTHQN